MEITKQYIIIKDAETNKPIARKEIQSKAQLENVSGYIINGTLLFGYAEFSYMQQLATHLPDLEDEA
jgi:hypothetical protein